MMKTVKARRFNRRSIAAAVISGAAVVALLAGCSTTGGSSSSASGTTKDFKVGVITSGSTYDWSPVQGDIASALAKTRGWSSVVLSDDNDASTLQKDVNTLIQDHVNAVIGFFGVQGVNTIIAKRLSAAKIPVITYDIAQKGWYFVGVNNAKSGQINGQALGEIAKQKWNCDVDLVMLGGAASLGAINTERTGGSEAGFKSVCPNVPASDYKTFETAGELSVGLPAARNILAADPSAQKIAALGLNDPSVQASLEAEKQLGGSAQIIGWGQDGSLIGTSAASPNMLGSAFYFLEGYPVYAFQILDKIAAGKAPAVKDTSTDGLLVPPCLVTAAQAKAVPSMAARAKKIESTGEAAYSLFCPAKN